MRMIRFLAFAAPLAFLLPLTAQADNWPAGQKADYMKECVPAANKTLKNTKLAEQHCTCGADKLSAKLSTTEIQQLMNKEKQPDQNLVNKALTAIEPCKVKAAK